MNCVVLTTKYSVIIPVYNAEKTICRCLDSLLNQKHDAVEIILINDGSKDRSGEICRSYANENSCIIYIEQENAGASAARNAGLNVASGEYITFVDSDDYVLDGYFSMLDRSEDDFVVYGYQIIKQNSTVQFQFSQELLNADSIEGVVLSVLKNRIAAPWNKRFKRVIIEESKIRFKPELIIGEDFIFGLEYMLRCKSGHADPSYLYCVDETGMDSITRAAKYDYTQFARIYGHAFRIAEQCLWKDSEKQNLVRQLDSLYCRTSFAVVEHCLNSQKKTIKGVADILSIFQKRYQPKVAALNIAHFVMRLCVQFRVLPVYVTVALLYRFVRKMQ